FNGLFAKEINHYVNCLLDGIECLSPAKDGVEIMRILDAIYESAALGHEIILQ
ncbi:MAG TPA: oxidoreductase, partial [Clostridiales bacterium]|nr:oxidoreductase [Clostridiales bacterium]